MFFTRYSLKIALAKENISPESKKPIDTYIIYIYINGIKSKADLNTSDLPVCWTNFWETCIFRDMCIQTYLFSIYYTE